MGTLLHVPRDPWGHVPCVAPMQQKAGISEGTSVALWENPQQQQQQRRRRSPTDVWNGILLLRRPWDWVYRHTSIFKAKIADFYFFSKAMMLRFKAFLSAQDGRRGLWKIQQHINLLMQHITVTCFKTTFKVLWCYALLAYECKANLILLTQKQQQKSLLQFLQLFV